MQERKIRCWLGLRAAAGFLRGGLTDAGEKSNADRVCGSAGFLKGGWTDAG